MVKIFFKYNEIVKNIEKLLCHKTEDLINRIYSDESLIIFQSFYADSCSHIRSEFIMQILLVHHSENCDCKFHNQLQKVIEIKENQLLHLSEKKEQAWENEKLLLYKKFKKWLHLTLFLQEEEFFIDSRSYSIISLMFHRIISLFLYNESNYGNEKTKGLAKSRFTSPLQTLLVYLINIYNFIINLIGIIWAIF